jgi:Sulfotransferase family
MSHSPPIHPLDPRQDYFFVVGCPRSGTTLMSVLLDRHPRLAVTPETAFFDEMVPHLWYHYNDPLLLRLLSQWRRLPELNLTPADLVGQITRREAVAKELFSAMLQLYARRSGKVRCGEKTPQHLRKVPTMLKWFPNGRAICMLRDGRAAALSLFQMPWYHGSLRSAASCWLHSVRLMERFARTHPDRFMVVRYESLVADPEPVMNSVMAFLGETYDPRQLSTAVTSEVVLDRSMDWKGKALTTIDASAAVTRQAHSTPSELALLDRLLGDELLRYGY